MLARLRGDNPRPKRKRAFHRALKRGEPWAIHRKLMIECFKSATDRLAQGIYESSGEVPKMEGLLKSVTIIKQSTD